MPKRWIFARMMNRHRISSGFLRRRFIFLGKNDELTPDFCVLQLVNQPQTEAEVAALRCCVNHGRPFGDPNCA